MDDEEYKNWVIECQEIERRMRDDKARAAKRKSMRNMYHRHHQWERLPLSVQLQRLLQEQDAGFVGNDPRREAVRRAIKRVRGRITGRDPKYSTVGPGVSHVPEHKKDEYEMRCIVLDIMDTLDNKQGRE